MTLLEALKDPPKKHRPVPFWSWNERFCAETTRRQIEQMETAGMGGYFIYRPRGRRI